MWSNVVTSSQTLIQSRHLKFPLQEKSAASGSIMAQVTQTILVLLLIAHIGTTGNVTEPHHSLTRRCTPTQTAKAISILSPADYIWRGNSD